MGNRREENAELNLAEYRDGKTRLRSRPRYLAVELTQGCNLRCPMCRDETIGTKERSMTDELFQAIASELFPTADVVDLRGWGESLLLPDIATRINEVAQHGAEVRFVTNLSFARPDVLTVLAKHGCHVAVSVDTADPHLFGDLRGGARLEQVAANLDALVASYSAFHGNASRVYLTTTVQRPALDGLHSLIDFAADRGLSEVRLFGVTAPPGSPLSIEEEPSDVDAALDRCAARARARGVRLQVGTRMGSLPENPVGGPHCLHPWAYAYVAYDGRVGFCDHLIGPAGDPYLVGDLRSATFESIWNGPTWEELRREHLGHRDPAADRFAECAWCYKNRYVDFEHILLPEAATRLRVL